MIAIRAGWANALQSAAIFLSLVLNSLAFVIAIILIILYREYAIIHAEVNRNLIKIFDSPYTSFLSTPIPPCLPAGRQEFLNSLIPQSLIVISKS